MDDWRGSTPALIRERTFTTRDDALRDPPIRSRASRFARASRVEILTLNAFEVDVAQGMTDPFPD
jgi:hypothetical protein